MHLGRGGISSTLLRFPSRATILLVIILNPNLLTVYGVPASFHPAENWIFNQIHEWKGQILRLLSNFWWSWPDAAFLILALSGNLALSSLGPSATLAGRSTLCVLE